MLTSQTYCSPVGDSRISSVSPPLDIPLYYFCLTALWAIARRLSRSGAASRAQVRAIQHCFCVKAEHWAVGSN